MSSFTVPPPSPPPSTTTTTTTSSLPSSSDMEVECTHTLIAKWSKQRLSFDMTETMTIYNLKTLLTGRTSILQKRQKLIGLTPLTGKLTDATKISDLKVKSKKSKANETSSPNSGKVIIEFILMGTPEAEIFVDPENAEDLPDVVDDFGFDFNAGGDEWVRQINNSSNLQKYIKSTEIFMIEPLRDKPLLVLDLDHTLLDFSRRTIEQGGEAGSLKRPYMDFFLSTLYPHYNFIIWSQTSWRWLEIKLTELGMLTSPNYKINFVLDKTSMFKVESVKKGGEVFEHSVKPLQLIWEKIGSNKFGSHNTGEM
ncbi:hypothetical protein TL16_g05856 [Triparma laevis f. inornata]|uniref:FCP1 homology domain-containing protein n=1 Tax=Triparma laevis f. inornata TaxID=1714386 RepID=A0A9W7AG73_9STRA|nr:hypothetical protein TL16_g05856 [Triparma laevis f. inornata]